MESIIQFCKRFPLQHQMAFCDVSSLLSITWETRVAICRIGIRRWCVCAKLCQVPSNQYYMFEQSHQAPLADFSWQM